MLTCALQITFLVERAHRVSFVGPTMIMQSLKNNFKSPIDMTTCHCVGKHLIAQLVCWLLEEDSTDWISPLFPTLTGHP